jgi:class 3 adenylate cyclase
MTARRLAAIFAADIVGYSRLMGEDEADTARAVRERRDAAQPIVGSFGGRIVKTASDGVLAGISLHRRCRRNARRVHRSYNPCDRRPKRANVR